MSPQARPEAVLHMFTDAELEAIRRTAREDGAGLALATVINTLRAIAREHPGKLGEVLLDVALAIGAQGRDIIALFGERKAP